MHYHFLIDQFYMPRHPYSAQRIVGVIFFLNLIDSIEQKNFASVLQRNCIIDPAPYKEKLLKPALLLCQRFAGFVFLEQQYNC